MGGSVFFTALFPWRDSVLVTIAPGTPGGIQVEIFDDRVEADHHRQRVTFAALLGCMLAHEIGHVLKGSPRHSTYGIRKARWGPRDFHPVECGRLGFAAEQGRIIARSANVRYWRPLATR